MRYKVNDIVQVRQWDDMEREFGLNRFGIKCSVTFMEEMKQYCGKQFHILSIYNIENYKLSNTNGWVFSSDMFEKNPNSLGILVQRKMKKI